MKSHGSAKLRMIAILESITNGVNRICENKHGKKISINEHP
jgi:hypothetical protein